MTNDKQVKKEFKVKASKEPDKYYATDILKKEGFVRKRCKCGTYFWTVNPNQDVCGDPSCSGGFHFIGKSPATKEMDYIGVWKNFSKLFKKFGYTPIPRYPVVARWRDDTDFVQASIYDFQPYVVSGEVQPPANPLVVPQFCLRFNDIDNVGITGAHYTGFVMIGQHAFMPEEKWNQDKLFTDIYNWLKIGLGLKKEDITFHEDAWAGGGNFGPCMEYFSAGLELGNQVYMLYEQTSSGPKPLKLKVLDMGMGHERNAWFTKGTSTSYECVFPNVVKRLYSITGLKTDSELMKKFLPYTSFLNIDEIDSIDKAWKDVANKINKDVNELRNKIQPLAALYSVAEHSRSVLVALSDGALPSNVGGYYNLRVILRRALSFIDKYKWNIDLFDLCKLHAQYLKPLFPELSENLEEVKKILEVEEQKFKVTKEKSRMLVSHVIKEKITKEKLLQLYDSQGIAPEIIKEEAKKFGKEIEVPENFYAEVAALHEKKEQEHATRKEDFLFDTKFPETKPLYFDDYTLTSFNARVLGIVGPMKPPREEYPKAGWILLDKTAFYPTSGGQLHDTGTLNGVKILEVIKSGKFIQHRVEDVTKFKPDQIVEGKIDFERRKQLAQHHTATHIVNASARKVLGKHINQAGAKKTQEKAHLDITHYQSLTDEELKKIEKISNDLVKKALPVKSELLPRNEAEKKYGMNIYQGGAVPGKMIRIIDIKGTDVEACGGTHLKNTKEVGEIKILKSTKIQDGIVRITFTAGEAAQKEKKGQQDILSQTAKILGVTNQDVPIRTEELFTKWKKAKKAVKKNKKIDVKELELKSTDKYLGDCLTRTAEILKTQPEHIVKTIQRFLKELEEFKGKLKK